MKNSNVITIPINDNASLRIRKDNVVATVNIPGSDSVDIYVSGVANPWHVKNINSNELIGMIWEED